MFRFNPTRTVGACVAALSFALSPVAFAQEQTPRAAQPVPPKEKQLLERYETYREPSYGYRFEDDSLDAGGLGNMRLLRTRQYAPNETDLIAQPRTSFVPELLHSIEEL